MGQRSLNLEEGLRLGNYHVRRMIWPSEEPFDIGEWVGLFLRIAFARCVEIWIYSRKFFLSRKQEVTSRYFGPYDVVPRAFFFPRWFDWRVRINAKGKWKRKIIFYRAGFVLLLFFLFFLSFLFHLKFLDLCLSWLGRESGRMRRLISSPERPRPPCRPRPKAGRRKIPRPRP